VARPDGGTGVWQDEHFGGLLVPFVARSLDRGTVPAFHRMNEAWALLHGMPFLELNGRFPSGG
jgi:hypothetical protein